jgi:hypothetical protein
MTDHTTTLTPTQRWMAGEFSLTKTSIKIHDTSRDYSQCVIYKIRHMNPAIKHTYIGSTTDIRSRRYAHKTCVNNGTMTPLYIFIREHGGWDEWILEVIEKWPCRTSSELRCRERYHVEKLTHSLNVHNPIISEDMIRVDYLDSDTRLKIIKEREEMKKIKSAANRAKQVAKKNTTVMCPECGVTHQYGMRRYHVNTSEHRIAVSRACTAKLRSEIPVNKENILAAVDTIHDTSSILTSSVGEIESINDTTGE